LLSRYKFWESFCQPKRQKWSLKSHHGVLKMVVSMAAVHSPQWAHIPNIDAITPVIMPCDIHLCWEGARSLLWGCQPLVLLWLFLLIFLLYSH
jgi:hypothetical protein